jgi:hypothetical protein
MSPGEARKDQVVRIGSTVGRCSHVRESIGTEHSYKYSAIGSMRARAARTPDGEHTSCSRAAKVPYRLWLCGSCVVKLRVIR